MTPVELADKAVDRIKGAEVLQASEDCPFTDYAGREMLKALFCWFQAVHKRLPDSRSELEDLVEGERAAGRVPADMVFWALDPRNDFWERWFNRVAVLFVHGYVDSKLCERYRRQGRNIPDDGHRYDWPPNEFEHEMAVALHAYEQGPSGRWYFSDTELVN